MELEDDARTLAETIIDYWKEYDDGDYSPKGYCCMFCCGSSWEGYDEVVHDLDCPVLVAKDVLTTGK